MTTTKDPKCFFCWDKRYYTVMQNRGKKSLPCPRCNKPVKRLEVMIKVKCVECGLKQEIPLEKTKGDMPPMCKECFG